MSYKDIARSVSEQAGSQAEVTYQDYKKIKGFEDVGYLLQDYVISGGETVANPLRNDTIDVSEIVVNLNNDVMKRDGTSFTVTVPSTTYYLDFTKDGDWQFGTAHADGTVNEDYLAIASVSTTSAGLIGTIIDARGVVGGTRFKDEFGLEDYAKQQYVNEQLAETVRGKVGTGYKIIAGTVRNTGTGWQYIVDTAHKKTGLDTVEISPINSNRLRMNYDFEASAISALLVVPDETFAAYGLIVGSSVGKDYADIQISMPFSCLTKGTSEIVQLPLPLQAKTSIAALSDGSGFIITHKEAVSFDTPAISVMTQNTTDAVVPSLEARLSYSPTTIIVTAHAEMYGHISYDGSNWVVQTNNINKPTLSFNATTGTLTVNHEQINNSLGINVSGRGGSLPAVNTASNNFFEIRFFDFDGAVITTPSTAMRCFYSRPVLVKNIMPSDMRVAIRRGNVIVPPSDLTAEFGNFWIYGVMES